VSLTQNSSGEAGDFYRLVNLAGKQPSGEPFLGSCLVSVARQSRLYLILESVCRLIFLCVALEVTIDQCINNAIFQVPGTRATYPNTAVLRQGATTGRQHQQKGS
jgi:hypothetical protein